MERETVCLTESAGKGDLGNMSKVQMLEEELSLSKEENKRLQKLLDAVLQPQLRIHRAGLFPLLSINTLNSSVALYYHINNTLDTLSARAAGSTS